MSLSRQPDPVPGGQAEPSAQLHERDVGSDTLGDPGEPRVRADPTRWPEGGRVAAGQAPSKCGASGAVQPPPSAHPQRALVFPLGPPASGCACGRVRFCAWLRAPARGILSPISSRKGINTPTQNQSVGDSAQRFSRRLRGAELARYRPFAGPGKCQGAWRVSPAPPVSSPGWQGTVPSPRQGLRCPCFPTLRGIHLNI